MRNILHILTRPEAELTREVIARQQALGESTVELMELTSDSADYDTLVEKIFAADSVEVW